MIGVSSMNVPSVRNPGPHHTLRRIRRRSRVSAPRLQPGFESRPSMIGRAGRHEVH